MNNSRHTFATTMLRLALAVVLVDLGNTSKEISRCFSITALRENFAKECNHIRCPPLARLVFRAVVESIGVASRTLRTFPQNVLGQEGTRDNARRMILRWCGHN
jgi:hypothetical protein